VASKRLTPSDAVFLYMESRETMMHVASMLPFTPPPDTPPDHLRRLLDEIRAAPTVEPPWNRKLRTPELLVNPLQAWDADGSIDLDYHLRRSALPSPGDERELGIVVSRLHSHAIDFHRPPWEAHLIEGLEGGRFAFYVKVHHSLLDGYTAMRILAATLSTDANDRTRPLFFAVPPPRVEPEREPAGAPTERGLHFPELMAAVRAELGVTKTLTRALLNLSRAGREDALDLVSPLQAPHSILNGRISRARRFATQELETARLRALAKRAGGTLNDAILAICGTGLRRYLLEHGALPDAPLVAMMPVNIRPKDDAGGGNAVGGILASLATHLGDPGERLRAIIASTKRAKEQLQGMSKGAILRYSAILMSPFMLQLLPGAPGRIRPPFNLVVSNVPGPAEPLYFRGARLEGVYPMSIPVHGLALNITCNTYAGKVDFGFIGCRDTVPHLQRIAVHCGEALAELEAAVA
jgi:WS/DGAT/MGAT family acyltransferase